MADPETPRLTKAREIEIREANAMIVPQEECSELLCADVRDLLLELDAERTRREQAEAEVKVTDELLRSRQSVLDAIPACPSHGSCVPHALEWIASASKAEAERDDLRRQLEAAQVALLSQMMAQEPQA